MSGITLSASAKDVIKKSFLESGIFENTMTMETLVGMLISLAAATIMGFLIYIIYKVTFRGVVYSKSFSMTLVGMTVLTCMVTLAISTNIVLSLGMVGALSIVRYRTAVKEPFDLMFLFWAITSGIAIGAKMYLLTCLGGAFVLLLVFLLNARAVESKVYIMIVRYIDDNYADDIEGEIRRTLKDLKYSIKSKTLRGDMVEVAVEVDVRNNNLAFAKKIGELNGVEDLTLVQYNGEYHG
jgi:uncharacterized membrane protein YhiD involved in acid resistance